MIRKALLLILILFSALLCTAQTVDTAKTKAVPTPAVKPKVPAEKVEQIQKSIQYNDDKSTTHEKLREMLDHIQSEPTNLTVPAVSHQQRIFPLLPGEKAVIPDNNLELQFNGTFAALMDDELELPGSNRRLITGPSQYDSRVDIRSLDATLPWVTGILNNAQSVALVINRSKLHQVSKDYYQLDDSQTLGRTYQLCTGEAFAEQPVIGMATAFITGKQQMMTAGHVFSGPLNQYAILFGFEILNKTGAYQTIIPADSIYFPQKIISQSSDLDIAVFAVDRQLKAKPLQWSSEVNPPINEIIYMIGHPYGLPKKLSANASVQQNNDALCFYTTLDAFAGNSGSPVFNLQTNQVIGVLVGGQTDFRWTGSCYVSNICSIPYCEGEKVIRITAIARTLTGIAGKPANAAVK